MDHVFSIISKKVSLYSGSSEVSPVLPSRSVMVLCATFRSVINFELFFCEACKSMSGFFFFFFFSYIWVFSCSSNIC